MGTGRDDRSAEGSIENAARSAETPPRRKLLIARLVALVFGFGIAVAIIELAFRLPGIAWPDPLANYVLGCYEDDVATPIWDYDRRLEIRIPRPHVTTRCTFNGRTWQHRSDQLGYRNPADWNQADVVLLGDSMVYGHAVEERETFAHQLRGLLDVRVANHGRVGASAVEYLVQAKNLVPALGADVAVVFLYRNDVSDVNRTRTRAQLRRFVATGRGSEANAYPLSYFQDIHRRTPRASAAVRFASHLRSFRAARFFWRSEVLGQASTERLPFRAPYDPELGLAYIGATLRMSKQALADAGTQLVIGYMPASVIPGSNGARAAASVRRSARAWATELDVPYFDPSDALIGSDGVHDPRAYLSNDWHLSREGHRRIAVQLAAFLRREGLARPPRPAAD